MPSDNNGPDAKQRILDAATTLFAQKGYAATGMRELAAQAGVNLAMTNYYFGAKSGLLEAIFDRYFEQHYAVVKTVAESEGSIEERVRVAFRAFAKLFRENPAMVRVAFLELPCDAPEVVEHKAQRIRDAVTSVFGPVLMQLQAESPRAIQPVVVGPALMGMLLFHFLVRPVVEQAFAAQFDDDFYSQYPDQLADLFLYGIIGRAPRKSERTTDDGKE